MPRPRRHDDALRATLVDLAAEVVAAGGTQALSLRAVAGRAGTTTAAIYTLFGGREGLVRAVVEEGFRRFAERLDAVPHSADPGADLLALGVAYRENAVANPHYYRVMFGDAPGPVERDAEAGVPAVARPTFLVLHDAVCRLERPAEHGAPPEVALQLWALVHGLVSLELTGLLPGTPEERAGRYVAALRAARV